MEKDIIDALAVDFFLASFTFVPLFALSLSLSPFFLPFSFFIPFYFILFFQTEAAAAAAVIVVLVVGGRGRRSGTRKNFFSLLPLDFHYHYDYFPYIVLFQCLGGRTSDEQAAVAQRVHYKQQVRLGSIEVGCVQISIRLGTYCD